MALRKLLFLVWEMLPRLIWKPFWLRRQRRTHNFPFSAEADLSAAGTAWPGPAWPRPLQRHCERMQGNRNDFFIILAWRPKTTASFITRRVLQTAPSKSHSPQWQINLISAPLLFRFLASLSCLVRGVICSSSWNEGGPGKLSSLTVLNVIKSPSLPFPFFLSLSC